MYSYGSRFHCGKQLCFPSNHYCNVILSPQIHNKNWQRLKTVADIRRAMANPEAPVHG